MQNMLATLDAFWQKASLYMNLPKISITDIVEIIIIAFLIYYMLVWIKEYQSMDAASRFDGDPALCSASGAVPDEYDHLDCKAIR